MAHSDLETAISAAKAAGDILLEYFRELDGLTVTSKRSGDFVSQADLASENYLKEVLLAANPSDGWLGEETGASESSSRRWIVDPLDGTTNFLRGLPHWAVSISLEVDGVLTVGVVHDPVNKETYSAELGGGAFLNGNPISVSGNTDFSSALFATGIPFGTLPHIDSHAAQIGAIAPHCAGIRRIGAAALDLAYVAAGRFDGYWERNLRLWDIAAGLVLVREAGALATGWEKQSRPEEAGDVITGTPELFDRFFELLRQ